MPKENTESRVSIKKTVNGFIFHQKLLMGRVTFSLPAVPLTVDMPLEVVEIIAEFANCALQVKIVFCK